MVGRNKQKSSPQRESQEVPVQGWWKLSLPQKPTAFSVLSPVVGGCLCDPAIDRQAVREKPYSPRLTWRAMAYILSGKSLFKTELLSGLSTGSDKLEILNITSHSATERGRVESRRQDAMSRRRQAPWGSSQSVKSIGELNLILSGWQLVDSGWHQLRENNNQNLWVVG